MSFLILIVFLFLLKNSALNESLCNSVHCCRTTGRLDPLHNYIFYKVFGEKGNEVQLLSFINAVLGKTGDDKIISLEILENKSFLSEIMGGKSCVLDVRAQLHNGTMVNIEVQLRDKSLTKSARRSYWRR